MEEKPTKEVWIKAFKEMYDKAVEVNGCECKKCYGRGYTGWNEKAQQLIPCICLLKANNKMRLRKLRGEDEHN